jgi:hypothetical protein
MRYSWNFCLDYRAHSRSFILNNTTCCSACLLFYPAPLYQLFALQSLSFLSHSQLFLFSSADICAAPFLHLQDPLPFPPPFPDITFWYSPKLAGLLIRRGTMGVIPNHTLAYPRVLVPIKHVICRIAYPFDHSELLLARIRALFAFRGLGIRLQIRMQRERFGACLGFHFHYGVHI